MDEVIIAGDEIDRDGNICTLDYFKEPVLAKEGKSHMQDWVITAVRSRRTKINPEILDAIKFAKAGNGNSSPSSSDADSLTLFIDDKVLYFKHDDLRHLHGNLYSLEDEECGIPSSTLSWHQSDPGVVVTLTSPKYDGFKIIVKTLTGKIILYAERSDTIHDIKKKIQGKNGTPPDQQSLLLADRELEDDHTLLDYKICSDSTIHLRLHDHDGTRYWYHRISGRDELYKAERSGGKVKVKYGPHECHVFELDLYSSDTCESLAERANATLDAILIPINVHIKGREITCNTNATLDFLKRKALQNVSRERGLDMTNCSIASTIVTRRCKINDKNFSIITRFYEEFLLINDEIYCVDSQHLNSLKGSEEECCTFPLSWYEKEAGVMVTLLMGPTYLGQGSIRIFIKSVLGEITTLYVKPSETFDEIKAMYCDKTGIPPDDQRLIFSGKQMEDGKSVSDYGIRGDSVIHCVRRLRGGMYHPTSGRNGLKELSSSDSSSGATPISVKFKYGPDESDVFQLNLNANETCESLTKRANERLAAILDLQKQLDESRKRLLDIKRGRASPSSKQAKFSCEVFLI